MHLYHNNKRFIGCSVGLPIHNPFVVRRPVCIYAMLNDMWSPVQGYEERHRQHQGKRRKEGRLFSAMWSSRTDGYLYWSLPQVNLFQVRGVLTANENVVYVTWSYFKFGTTVVNIVTVPSQIRVQRDLILSCVNRILAIRCSVCSSSAIFG